MENLALWTTSAWRGLCFAASTLRARPHSSGARTSWVLSASAPGQNEAMAKEIRRLNPNGQALRRLFSLSQNLSARSPDAPPLLLTAREPYSRGSATSKRPSNTGSTSARLNKRAAADISRASSSCAATIMLSRTMSRLPIARLEGHESCARSSSLSGARRRMQKRFVDVSSVANLQMPGNFGGVGPLRIHRSSM